MPKQSQTIRTNQQILSEVFDEVNVLASKIQGTPAGGTISVQKAKGNYEKTKKTRDLVSGGADLTVNNTGEIENASGNVHVGTSKIGAGVEAQYDAQTGGVQADVNANAGFANMGVGIDTENVSGHIDIGVDAGALGFGTSVGGSEKSGLTMNAKANFAGFGVELSHTTKGPLANTRTVTATISAGPKSLAQHKTTVTQTITTKDHPLGLDKVLTNQTTTSVYTLGELQHEKVTMSSLRPDGKMNRKVLKDVSTPAYTAAGETFTGALKTVGGAGAMPEAYKDQIASDVMERMSSYGELAPDKSMINSIAEVAMHTNRRSLENIKTGNATANAITNGIVNELTRQTEERIKAGETTPITSHKKAELAEAIKLELDKIEAQIQALATTRPALAQAQALALASATTSPLSKAESQGKLSRNVESGTYVGASEEYSPEDFQTVAQNQAQLERNTQILNARRAANLLGQALNLSVPSAPTDVKSVTVRGVLKEAKVSAGTTNQPAPQTKKTVDFAAIARSLAGRPSSLLGTKTVEAGNYAGPSQEYSVEDFQSASQNRAQLNTQTEIKSAMNTPAYRESAHPDVQKTRKDIADAWAGYTARREQTKRDQAKQNQQDQKTPETKAQANKGNRALSNDLPSKQDTLGQKDVLGEATERAKIAGGLLDSDPTQPSDIDRVMDRMAVGQRAKVEREKNLSWQDRSWSTMSSYDQSRTISAEKSRRRGAARSKNAHTPRGTNAYGEKTTGQIGSLGRGGQLSSVGAQKAKANQKNRAANKDGSYTLDAEGNGAGDAGGTVICTELYHQSFLPLDVYIADQRYGLWIEKNDPYVMLGYHFLAKPVVRLMQNSKLFTQVLYTTFAKPWAAEMVVKQGHNGIGSLRGKTLFAIGLPVCRAIGWVLATDTKHTQKMTGARAS